MPRTSLSFACNQSWRDAPLSRWECTKHGDLLGGWEDSIDEGIELKLEGELEMEIGVGLSSVSQVG